MPRLYQGSMSGGEADPGVWGRIDLERFGSMVRVGRNVLFLPEGGAMKRPGLEFIGFAHGTPANINAAVRPIPFRFNNDQTYIVYAMADRIYFSKNGGIILEARVGSGALTAGQDGSGTYINAAGNGLTYVAGDIIFVTQGGFLEIEQRWLRVASSPAPTASRVYLNDYLLNTSLPTSGFTASGSSLDYGKIYTRQTANGWYSTVDPMELDYTQANDKLYISHPSQPTKVVTRTSDTAWTITDFNPAPTNTPPTVAESAGSNPPAGSDTVKYAVTSIETANGTFEESLADLFEVTNVDSDTLNPVDFIELEWTHVAGNDKYRVYRAIAGIYGLIGLAEGTSGTITFRDTGFVPNAALAPPLEADIFGAVDEYPGAVELAQQRIWFGRTNKLIRDVYGSRAGSLSSFATSTVGTDDDPIELAIAARSVHEVRHFVPLKDLIVMTSDGEWGFDTGDDGLISTRSGLIAHSYWGSSKVKPVVIGESAVFVERSGRVVRDLAFALQSDGFASSNLSLFAKHLFKNRQVVDLCFSQTPFNVVFVVMSDGQGAFCTYVRDQQVFAWSRADTNGKMKACASVEESGQDNIYVVVERVYNGTTPYRQIERMNMVDPEFVEQGLWLDNSTEFNRPNQYAADPFDGTCTDAQTVIDGTTLTLRMRMTENALNTNELMQFQAAAGSALSVFDGLTFMVEQMNDPSGGRETYKLYRTVNADTTKKKLLDVDGLLPKSFFASGVVGYFNDGEANVYRAHQLNYRAGLVTIRADMVEFKDLTLATGGRYQFSANPLAYAGKIHAGEPFICEIETLDIDSPENPITGLPIQIGELLLRFSLVSQVSVGRRRFNFSTTTQAMMRAQPDYDLNRGCFRGVLQTHLKPDWRRDGRVVIRSEDSFPFVLSALIPSVDVGTIDEDN